MVDAGAHQKGEASCSDVKKIMVACKPEAVANDWAVSIAAADDGGNWPF
jgi:hypothetical protein